jgi:hypothetical protein
VQTLIVIGFNIDMYHNLQQKKLIVFQDHLNPESLRPDKLTVPYTFKLPTIATPPLAKLNSTLESYYYLT